MCFLLFNVCLKVEVVRFIALGQLGEYVDNMALAQALFAVADNDEVGDTTGDGVEIGFCFGRLTRGHLEHDLNFVEQLDGEILAIVEFNRVGGFGL